MNHSAYDDVTGVEEDPKHPDTPDSPRPGLGHLRAPRTHSPASDPESYRALVAVPGRAPLQVSRAQQGSTGYPPQLSANVGLRLGPGLGLGRGVVDRDENFETVSAYAERNDPSPISGNMMGVNQMLGAT